MLISKKSHINGKIEVPASKSHTIRALVSAMFADGTSYIKNPLDSADTRSCLKMIELFGANVCCEQNYWIIKGTGGQLSVPDDIVDIGNSGTSLYIGLAIATVLDGASVFTGDSQIRNRPADPLINSLIELGTSIISSRNNGKAPFIVTKKAQGGKTSIEAASSQYLSALLMAAPLFPEDTIIDVLLLNEKPYIDITLSWLDKCGIKYVNENYKKFTVYGNQSYKPFEANIPADFSSAAFFAVAALVTNGEVELCWLDMNDPQGDKAIFNILQDMGAEIKLNEKSITIKADKLHGGDFDLNSMPDMLPILAVVGCFAEGTTKLYNVSHARIKETDRISVMCKELSKFGVNITETVDGLIIKGNGPKGLRGGYVDGHFDHRVIMSLAVAGLGAESPVYIENYESLSATLPNFINLMNGIEANIKAEYDTGIFVRGIRGAVTIQANTRDEIISKTQEMLNEIVKRNDVKLEDIASVIFSVTDDIDEEFPAVAAREMGWNKVPLFCTREINVKNGLPLCIRVLIHINTDKPQNLINHVYLYEAKKLRVDI
jgi:3-phosphoshikimate 1-carboxyvinyltransferase